jgi:hypothetical protein
MMICRGEACLCICCDFRQATWETISSLLKEFVDFLDRSNDAAEEDSGVAAE